MPSELTQALAAIPGYPEAAQAAATLSAHFRRLRAKRLDAGINPVFRYRQQLTEQLQLAALDGQELPDDLTAHDWGQAWQDATRTAQEDLLFQALNEAATSAESQRRHLLTWGANTALAHLDDQLQQLLATIRDSQATDQHAAAYTAIRQAQRQIFVEAQHSATRHQLNTYGEMADLYERWPRWSKDGKPGIPAPQQKAPWVQHGSDPDACTYTAGYLQWAVRQGVHLWVPTFPQLQAAATRDTRLREQQEIHRQNVANGALPRERFTIPDELSIGAFLAEHSSKEPAHV
ncbi:hypothetical protein [Streptomyces sp. NPDC090057]|uniref:hypothetical protein n=1 Tax=Streptomyces sp. NPDC090057 TaxID=3365935 RepID=UPI0037FC2EF9